ncbi:hypothetical protein HF888_14150 [Bermanella marisrubri]|uniref:Uncharacterized protein n=1 Tax=Bermanella marisrubri TaxID=207949 RepID=Q1MZE9_9GAMM|nr:hypothetical protein [Bermanella marisrubri]EAT11317.1 hypothetical protein RED65_12857 [Oceanobacter sp. RED65] [Bermanella marisrubri]QIZ85295.1 hypothetical protein HF888_14150 [Bermanella marisrubri]
MIIKLSKDELFVNTIYRFTGVFALPMCFALSSQAGTLDDLERNGTQAQSKNTSSSSQSTSKKASTDSHSSAISEAIAEIVFKTTIKLAEYSVDILSVGGSHSMQRYRQSEPVYSTNDDNEASAASDSASNSFFRQVGDPILPALKLSTQFFDSTDDIYAQLNRVELGYGSLGVSYSQNILNEQDDELSLENTLLHYRMSFGNNFSWDLAYGRGKMNGNQSHKGDVFAMPIRLRVNHYLHAEFYPIWSSYNGGSISERQFSLNYHYQYVGITLGYKKWSAGPTTIDGFFSGLYVSF